MPVVPSWHLGEFSARGVVLLDEPSPELLDLVSGVPEGNNLHLAILRNPYFDYILDGTKTVESRFSQRRVAPFGRIATGDVVLLKESGKPIANYFVADWATSQELGQGDLDQLKNDHEEAICADEEFWRRQQAARYATLVGIGERGVLAALRIYKADQRAWVVFDRDASPAQGRLF